MGKCCCLNQCFTKYPSAIKHRRWVLLEIHFTKKNKITLEIGKTNSEQMETRLYCSKKKYIIIVVSKAEQLQEWTNLDRFLASHREWLQREMYFIAAWCRWHLKAHYRSMQYLKLQCLCKLKSYWTLVLKKTTEFVSSENTLQFMAFCSNSHNIDTSVMTLLSHTISE